jgi:hypothetical protein
MKSHGPIRVVRKWPGNFNARWRWIFIVSVLRLGTEAPELQFGRGRGAVRMALALLWRGGGQRLVSGSGTRPWGRRRRRPSRLKEEEDPWALARPTGPMGQCGWLREIHEKEKWWWAARKLWAQLIQRNRKWFLNFWLLHRLDFKWIWMISNQGFGYSQNRILENDSRIWIKWFELKVSNIFEIEFKNWFEGSNQGIWKFDERKLNSISEFGFDEKGHWHLFGHQNWTWLGKRFMNPVQPRNLWCHTNRWVHLVGSERYAGNT